MTLSVLFPFKNSAQYIVDAVQSLNAQSFTNFEVVAVNDGSADDSEELFKHAAEFPYKLIHTGGMGVAGALNKGLEHCARQYIARFDSDDIALPNRFEAQYRFMEANKHIDVLGGQAVLCDGQGEITGETIRKPTGVKRVRRYARFACPTIHPTLFFRSHVLLASGYWNINPSQDYELIAYLLNKGVLVDNLSEALVCYRRTDYGGSGVNVRKTLCMAATIRTAFRKSKLRTKESCDAFSKNENVETSAKFRRRYDRRNEAIRLLRSGDIWSMACGTAMGVSALVFEPLLMKDTYAGWRARRTMLAQE